MKILTSIKIEPKQPPIASIIWLHGLGANGNDFEPFIQELQIPEEIPIRFILPNAPNRPVTVNDGISMPAWYDIVDVSLDKKVDKENIKISSEQITTLIELEIEKGIPSHKILLAGFSQGGVIALYTGLRYSKPLAGIMALSTYLAPQENLESEISPANSSIPIFMAHGTLDPIVPLSVAENSKTKLMSLNYSVDWKTYPMAHSVCLQEGLDIRNWLLTRFKT